MTITDKQVEAARRVCFVRALAATPEEIASETRRMRAALEAAEEARGCGKPVAWVEVKDSYEGPYEFHGAEYLPAGRHDLFLADQATLREVTPAAPSSAEQPPRVMIDGVDMTAQIRAAAIKDTSIPAPFGYVDPAAQYSAAAFAFEPHAGKTVPVYLAPSAPAADAAAVAAMATRWVAAGMMQVAGQGSASEANAARDAFRAALYGTAPSAPAADERDAFQDELIRLGYRRDRNAAGDYVGTAANYMWMGWRARAQLVADHHEASLGMVAPARAQAGEALAEAANAGPLPQNWDMTADQIIDLMPADRAMGDGT